MDVLRTYRIKPGQFVYSNQYQPLLKIVRETVGVHDFFNSACRPEMYEVLYDKKDHASCYHNSEHGTRTLRNLTAGSTLSIQPVYEVRCR